MDMGTSPASGYMPQEVHRERAHYRPDDKGRERRLHVLQRRLLPCMRDVALLRRGDLLLEA
ncbi:MAG: hypothetical protein HYX56_00745 [Chloroflexi bacterium]|nr:hypothetical protein [Chloroflexota bacterium]